MLVSVQFYLHDNFKLSHNFFILKNRKIGHVHGVKPLQGRTLGICVLSIPILGARSRGVNGINGSGISTQLSEVAVFFFLARRSVFFRVLLPQLSFPLQSSRSPDKSWLRSFAGPSGKGGSSHAGTHAASTSRRRRSPAAVLPDRSRASASSLSDGCGLCLF